MILQRGNVNQILYYDIKVIWPTESFVLTLGKWRNSSTVNDAVEELYQQIKEKGYLDCWTIVPVNVVNIQEKVKHGKIKLRHLYFPSS